MTIKNILFILLISIVMNTFGQNKENRKLTEEERRVIIEKGTEAPFTGKYEKFDEVGIYTCKQCCAELYRSSNKFDAHCGWPSFDEEIPGAVTSTLDADGRRTEITCSNCGAHLGHVFVGEHFTPKNTRHCVNSISLEFKPVTLATPTEETAYFASGCFWGVQYQFQKKKGLISTQVGYMGGSVKNPNYQEVSTGTTGHAETLKVVFDPQVISFEDLAKLFFETHDPSQLNQQGPDVGTQYRSAVFYTSEEQKKTTQKLMAILEKSGVNVVTELTKAAVFYPAEEYHQNYYQNKGGSPYCHIYQKKF